MLPGPSALGHGAAAVKARTLRLARNGCHFEQPCIATRAVADGVLGARVCVARGGAEGNAVAGGADLEAADPRVEIGRIGLHRALICGYIYIYTHTCRYA